MKPLRVSYPEGSRCAISLRKAHSEATGRVGCYIDNNPPKGDATQRCRTALPLGEMQSYSHDWRCYYYRTAVCGAACDAANYALSVYQDGSRLWRSPRH